MRAGNSRNSNSNSNIDLTPLLDTAFILVFLFVLGIMIMSGKIEEENERRFSVSKNEINEANENIDKLKKDLGISEEELEKLKALLSEYEMENGALKDENERIKEFSESDEKLTHLDGYEKIGSEATLICVKLEGRVGKRKATVLVNDLPEKEPVEFDDDNDDISTDKIRDIVDGYLNRTITSNESGKPKFIYISRNEMGTLFRDVDEIEKKLSSLKDKYENLYIVR